MDSLCLSLWVVLGTFFLLLVFPQRGRFAPHWELCSQAKMQKFAISNHSNFQCSTRFFIYQSIILKFSGFLSNTLNRPWFDFERDRTFTFEVIKVFIFSRILNFTREYLTKVAKSHFRTSSWVHLPGVKIWSKSVQPFPRYRVDKFRYGRTHGRTLLTHRGLSLKPLLTLQKLFALVTLSFL